MKKNPKKIKIINQKSFYFEDYLETNKKKNLKKQIIFKIEFIYYFFFFFSLILIFSIKLLIISFDKKNIFNLKNKNLNFLYLRRDIVDRNGYNNFKKY